VLDRLRRDDEAERRGTLQHDADLFLGRQLREEVRLISRHDRPDLRIDVARSYRSPPRSAGAGEIGAALIGDERLRSYSIAPTCRCVLLLPTATDGLITTVPNNKVTFKSGKPITGSR